MIKVGDLSVLVKLREKSNTDMNKIFAKHNIKPESGDEEFWNAVGDVEYLNQKDFHKLMKLADQWEEVRKEIRELPR